MSLLLDSITSRHHQRRVQAHAGFGGLGKAAANEAKRQCACGSGKLYQNCCKPLHTSAKGKFTEKPTSAEACCRARFSAYCVKSAGVDLLVKTTADSARTGSVSADGKVSSTFEQDIKVTMSWAEFKGLRVLSSTSDGPDKTVLDIEYSVKKVYDLKSGAKLKDAPWETLRESATFVRQSDGGWYFAGAENTNWDRNTLQVV